MFVLYNGDYVDYDITQAVNWEQTLEYNNLRKNYIGQQFGDFEIVVVDYDWGSRKQVNIAQCVKCGEKKAIVNLSCFKRGRGEGLRCKCRFAKKAVPQVSVSDEYKKRVGEVVSGFKLLDYQAGKGFRVECVECGNQKWASGAQVFDGRVECKHKKVRDYSDSKYIGKKIASLTVVGREGKKLRFRCDCGEEIVRRAHEVFRDNGAKSCGRPECLYHKAALYEGHNTRLKGLKFEAKCAELLQQQGIETEMTPGTGDYGVDFFAYIDGEKVAFQCKRLKSKSMVSAVQEVYAGGRYYDCCKFVVVSPSGFSYPAELMAHKLGVQLEIDVNGFCLKDLEECVIETNKIQTYSRIGLIWEMDGVAKPADEWCREYGVSRATVMSRIKKGDDLKTALTKPKYLGKTVEIDGVVKTKIEWCEEYGISTQLYDYRVKTVGMTPMEALTTLKKNVK